MTDRRSLLVANSADKIAALTQKIAEILAAGVDWVQIREKDLTAREQVSLARKSLEIVAASSAESSHIARILVNDRLDVAIAGRAGGVHLGEHSLPVAEARRLAESAQRKLAVDASFLIGVSCHSLESAQAAERDGADYILFGPVFATPSKETFGPAQGTERLKQVCHAISVPVLAIGGLTTKNANSCLQAGAAGLAAIRLFQNAPDPVLTVRRLHQLSTDFRR